MARKLRIEYPGALYHVVNRGNYRQGLYESAGAAKAFLTILEEAVKMFGWKLHAYILMSNHFHLVLETPLPNLSSGMHWLQSTYGIRFNRYRTEQGHLFQGRFYAGLLEDQRILGHVVDYVHLNPVRAKITPVEQADRYLWSSLGAFVRGPRMPGLTSADWLPQWGCDETAQGWARYLAHLSELASNLEAQEKLGWKNFSRAWAIGGESWKHLMAEEHAHQALNPGLERSVLKELHEARWETALTDMLKEIGNSRENLARDRKGASWKVDLALRLRAEHGAASQWLAQALHLGTPSSARSLICLAKEQKINNNRPDPFRRE